MGKCVRMKRHTLGITFFIVNIKQWQVNNSEGFYLTIFKFIDLKARFIDPTALGKEWGLEVGGGGGGLAFIIDEEERISDSIRRTEARSTVRAAAQFRLVDRLKMFTSPVHRVR